MGWVDRPGSLAPPWSPGAIYFERMSIRYGLVRRPSERDGSAAMAPAARLERSSQMRFMFIVKSAHPGPPSPALAEAMHKLADREIKAGRLLDMGGLMPLATGAQVRITDGRLGVVDGPFVEAKEVIGGYATPQGSHAGLGRGLRASRVCFEGLVRRGAPEPSAWHGRRP
jgi:hypothetical protein